MRNIGIVAEIVGAARSMGGFKCSEATTYRVVGCVVGGKSLHAGGLVNGDVAERIHRRRNLRRVIGDIDGQLAVQGNVVAVAIGRDDQRTEIEAADRTICSLKIGIMAAAADMVELVIELEREVTRSRVQRQREDRPIDQRLIVGIRESRENGLVDIGHDGVAAVDQRIAQLAVVRGQAKAGQCRRRARGEAESAVAVGAKIHRAGNRSGHHCRACSDVPGF